MNYIDPSPEYYTIDAKEFLNPEKKFLRGRLPRAIEHWVIPSEIPHESRLVLERIGYFLKREEDLDFPPYSASLLVDNEFGHIFSVPFTEETSRPIGGASFSKKRWNDGKEGFLMDWIWFHPYYRRKGILSAAWATLVADYGQFPVSLPCSPVMALFREK